MNTQELIEWLANLADEHDNNGGPLYADSIRDAIERLRALEAPKPQGRTVRVRIACAVEPDGSWFSFGTDNMPDPMSVAKVAAGQHGRAHWITADLPIPEPVEVQGRVEGNHTGDSNGT